MPKDPTGYNTALATIPKGQLSERQMRISTAVAMVRDGTSLTQAAKRCKVPLTTLHRYVHRVSDAEVQEQDNRAQDLLHTSYDIANLAAEAIQTSLVDSPDEWKPGDLVKAYGVATDKTINLTKTPQATNPGISALAQLLESSDITLTKRDDTRDAIDITPEGD